MMPALPTLAYELHLHQHGYSAIAGVDEVGRGALAGPIYAGAVLLPDFQQIAHDLAFWQRVRDSKTITERRRTELADGIKQRSRAWTTAAIDAPDIDRIGIAAANRLAMELAVRALPDAPDILLIDAMTIDSEFPQIGIIDGDALSLSIAAASIIAKVARDTEMAEADAVWPGYDFGRHKGYGTRAHLTAVELIGPCPCHRTSYAPIRRALERRDERT